MHLLCEAPTGPFRQEVPVPFFGGSVAGPGIEPDVLTL